MKVKKLPNSAGVYLKCSNFMQVFMEPKERSNTEYKLKTMVVSTGNLPGEMLFSNTSHKLEDI